jgi:hypothetical protein
MHVYSSRDKADKAADTSQLVLEKKGIAYNSLRHANSLPTHLQRKSHLAARPAARLHHKTPRT